MGMIEFALIVSIVIALYNIQQIKMTLKEKGHSVEMFSNPLEDVRLFKKLMLDEPDQKVKLKYQKILNGLYFCLVGMVLFAIMMINKRM